MAESKKIMPDWNLWVEGKPEEPGVYLTHWSDGSVETYEIDADELQKEHIRVGLAVLLHWAENVAAPTDDAIRTSDLVKSVYAEGYRDGIVQGKRDGSEQFDRESPRSCIDADFEGSKARQYLHI